MYCVKTYLESSLTKTYLESFVRKMLGRPAEMWRRRLTDGLMRLR
jgi:hypothetical protein